MYYEKNLKRMSSFYVNEVHLITMLLPYIEGKISEDCKIHTILQNDLEKTVNVLFGELEIEPNIAVDTHVTRVSKRLGLAKENDDVYEIEMKLRRKFKRDTWNKRHKQLVLFGRYYCKAIKPECDTCKLKNICKEKNKK